MTEFLSTSWLNLLGLACLIAAELAIVPHVPVVMAQAVRPRRVLEFEGSDHT